MRRHAVRLLIILAFSLLLTPLAADAQPPAKVPQIGFLSLYSPAPAPRFFEIFQQTLHEFGYVEGENLRLEYRWAEGRAEQLPELAAELVRLEVDVIVAMETPVIFAAQQATSAIPIVIVAVVDPVAAGLVESIRRPEGNITGVTGLVPQLGGKLLELLKDAVPQVSRVGVLWNPEARGAARWFQELQGAAHVLGVALQSLEVRESQDFERAFEAATEEGAGALLMLPALLFARNERRLAELAVKSRLPAIFWRRSFAEAGGLMAYGPHFPELWRRAAALVGKILKGAKPWDLPVEQPMRFELVINLKTAQALGLTIPPHLLVFADEVIR